MSADLMLKYHQKAWHMHTREDVAAILIGKTNMPDDAR